MEKIKDSPLPMCLDSLPSHIEILCEISGYVSRIPMFENIVNSYRFLHKTLILRISYLKQTPDYLYHMDNFFR